jgi:dGTPase
LIENTRSNVASSSVQSVEDVRHAPRRLAGFSASLAAENAALKKFLLARLYNHPAIVVDRERSVEALAQLFDFYVEHPGSMPKAYAELAQHIPKYRVVCDYIAGMTDHFLLRQHAELLGTSSARSV